MAYVPAGLMLQGVKSGLNSGITRRLAYTAAYKTTLQERLSPIPYFALSQVIDDKSIA
jgi:hypothetical protein